MPGIIDTHSHFAVEGGVNEFSLSVVPEVRVRDVVDGDDVQIYRALAGGVTTARLLHGSANCVGGQTPSSSSSLESRAATLIVTDGPRGVKFALTARTSNGPTAVPQHPPGRGSSVHPGVFTEALEYRKLWLPTRAEKSGPAGAGAATRPATSRAALRRSVWRHQGPLPFLPGGRDPDAPPRCRPVRVQDPVTPARPSEDNKIAPEIAAHGRA